MVATLHRMSPRAEELLEAARAGSLLIPSVFADLREGRVSEDEARTILRELENVREHGSSWTRLKRAMAG